MSSSSSTAGPGGSTERLQGSLRHSAIARLLVEGRLSVSSSPPPQPPPGAATDKVDDRRRRGVDVTHSPPPPIDLSTSRTSSSSSSSKQVNDSTAAAASASFSLSTITTIEKLRCILTYEIQSLLSRGDFSRDNTSSSNHSILCICRLCPFNAPDVIELLDHYRLHGDTLGHLGHKSPDILIQWFDYYLKTSPKRCSSQSLCGVNDHLGSTTSSADSSTGTSPSSRLDLRSLLLKPFKATNALLLSSDRPTPNRHRVCSESNPLRIGCRAPATDGGTQSRSSTPYTMISGLTDDENQQPFYAGSSRCHTRRGQANGRQNVGMGGGGGGNGIYHDGLVAIKCETDDTATSPVRSPMSTYSAHSVKDKRPNSQDSHSSGADYLGQFQNGRLKAEQGHVVTTEERSPPTLKCEVESGGGGRCSPYADYRGGTVSSHCIEIDKYLTNLRGHLHPQETLRKSSSNIARLLHPSLRGVLSDERSPNLSYSPSQHPEVVAPTIDQLKYEQQMARPSSKSPVQIQFRETVVEQEYAYKQYKRLRKNNAPKSCRQGDTAATTSPCHNLSKDDSGLSGTPSLPLYDESDPVLPLRGAPAQMVGLERRCCSSAAERVTPQGYDVGVQCTIISPAEPWIVMTEAEEEGEEDDEEDEERSMRSRKCRMSEKRIRRKRAFPADENEMPDITASDADCVQMRCSPCGITFDDDVIFSIHMGCHSHTDPFVCNICGRPCDNKYAFNTHILRGHHPT